MPTSLIGIGGALTAGKDTVADHLVDKHGWKKHWMSEPLNEALLVLNPVIEQLSGGSNFQTTRTVRYADLVAEVGYTRAKEHPEVRRLLQKMGTEVGRNMIDENVWVDMAGRSIDDSRSLEQRNVVITGVRFRNELKMIRSRGGILLWVDRPALTKSSSSSAHASENSLVAEDFDVQLMNDRGLGELYDLIDYELPSWSSVPAYRSRRPDLELDIWPVYDH